MTKFETFKEPGAAHWACYLINGDCSGMEDDEIAECDAWHDRLGDYLCLTLDDGAEPYFSNSYGFHTGSKYRGGDLIDYSVSYRSKDNA